MIRWRAHSVGVQVPLSLVVFCQQTPARRVRRGDSAIWFCGRTVSRNGGGKGGGHEPNLGLKCRSRQPHPGERALTDICAGTGTDPGLHAGSVKPYPPVREHEAAGGETGPHDIDVGAGTGLTVGTKCRPRGFRREVRPDGLHAVLRREDAVHHDGFRSRSAHVFGGLHTALPMASVCLRPRKSPRKTPSRAAPSGCVMQRPGAII